MPGTRDEQAVLAYEFDCARQGVAPTDEGRRDWIAEWRQLDRENAESASEYEDRMCDLWDDDYPDWDHDEGEEICEVPQIQNAILKPNRNWQPKR